MCLPPGSPRSRLEATQKTGTKGTRHVRRRLPFDDGNVGRLFAAIKAGAFSLPTHLSAGARDLICRMLTVDPLRRITIPEIRHDLSALAALGS